MKKLRILVMMMLVMTLCISASTQNNKEDDEGVPDDPNHMESVLAIREMLRADREMNKVYGMLIETFSDSRRAKVRIEKAQKAWLEYRDLQVDAEAAEMSGGHPEQAQRSITSAELTRERMARMKKMIGVKYEYQKDAEPGTTYTLRLKNMLDEIDKMEKPEKAKSQKK